MDPLGQSVQMCHVTLSSLVGRKHASLAVAYVFVFLLLSHCYCWAELALLPQALMAYMIRVIRCKDAERFQHTRSPPWGISSSPALTMCLDILQHSCRGHMTYILSWQPPQPHTGIVSARKQNHIETCPTQHNTARFKTLRVQVQV